MAQSGKGPTVGNDTSSLQLMLHVSATSQTSYPHFKT